MKLWNILGISPTSDLRAVKRAYAKKLKVTRPESDPKAYQELREAFDEAKRIAKQLKADEEAQLIENDASLEPLIEPENTALVNSSNLQQVPLEQSEVNDHIIHDQSADVSVGNVQPVVILDEHIETEGNKQPITVAEKEDLDAMGKGTNDELVVVSTENQESIDLHSQNLRIDNTENLESHAAQLTQSIHDCLSEYGEVAAVELFNEYLDSPELLSLDLAARFDAHMLNYLDWWAQSYNRDKGLKLPLGFMRQVINHYEWHKDSSFILKRYTALEGHYESIKTDCGIEFLRKVKAKQVLTHSPDFALAAERLLGKLKPKSFRLYSLSRNRRKAIYYLLTEIENLNDASFDFELNTDAIKWWQSSQEKFQLNAWMIVGAAFLAVFLMSYMVDFALQSSILQPVSKLPFIGIVAYILLVAFSTWIIYWFSYVGMHVYHFFKKQLAKVSGANQELLWLAIILSSLALLYFIEKAGGEAGSFLLAIIVMLLVIYKARIINIFMSIICIVLAFSLENDGDIFSIVSPYAIILPVLITHTALFYGCLRYKSKQLKTNFTLTGIPQKIHVFLALLLIISSFAYGLIFL